jgi:autotransporter-associated beta strand protein
MITGTGALTKQGAGMLTFTGDNIGTGPLSIATGTVRIGAGGATGVYAGDIANAGTLVIDRSGAVTLPGALSGTGDTIIAGPGAVTLAGRNASTGLTRVQAGSLEVTAADPFSTQAGIVVDAGASLLNTGTGAITVRNVTVDGAIVSTGGRLTATGLLSGSGSITGSVLTTGRFQGTQTISNDVTVTGIHAPGNSPGVQTIQGSLAYVLGSGTGPIVEWELDANTATNSPLAFDQIVVGTNLTFSTNTLLDMRFASAASTVDWDDGFWTTRRQWTIWQVSGTTTGLGNLSILGDNWRDSSGKWFKDVLPDAGFSITWGANGRDVILSYVPEPATWVSLLAGGAILAWRMRRRSLRHRRPPPRGLRQGRDPP